MPAFANLSFERPLFLTHVPDGSDRLVVLEQSGKAWIFPNRSDVSPEDRKIFVDLSAKTTPYFEMGLLGMAFHPKFAENKQVYVTYSERPPGRLPYRRHDSIIARFQLDPKDPNRIDAASEKVLMRIEQPYGNHNGGWIDFGPDGFLYVALGDGGAGGDPHGHGQNRKTLLGNILRIDVDREMGGKPCAIPPDNPFAGNDKGYREEIWAWGMRNPWRCSFDRKTGRLWAGDNGQNRIEEVHLIEKGQNCGWNVYEGSEPYRGDPPARAGTAYAPPVWEYLQTVGGRSVIGGYVYRGRKHPGLDGVYFCGDYVSGNVWGLWWDEEKRKVTVAERLLSTNLRITSFGEDAAGEVYVVAFNERQIYRIQPAR